MVSDTIRRDRLAPAEGRPRRLRSMPGRFYVTTPIYYVNDAPHMGPAYATVNADALARWHRIVGDDTFFLTGTDEHGLKVAQSAADAGISPKEQADLHAARCPETWDSLAVSQDEFLRNPEPRHHRSDTHTAEPT